MSGDRIFLTFLAAYALAWTAYFIEIGAFR
jgi:hypothetical protein